MIADEAIEQKSTPFFSIGVTTYNRHDLLKQTLASILAQTFADFEVIVGNDYTGESITAQLLGIEDSRIRFVNYPKNIGEYKNMNVLLAMSKGRYFTWQFDDDLYEPDFLEKVHMSLVKYNFPKNVFTSFKFIKWNYLHNLVSNGPARDRLFSGRDFLRAYLSGRIKTIGTTGVYDTSYLKQIGGVELFNRGMFAVHSEYFLLVKAGLLENVAYIYDPLVLYRVHQGSWGCTTVDIDIFKESAENFIKKSIVIFMMPKLRKYFYVNLCCILKLCIVRSMGVIWRRGGSQLLINIIRHLFYARTYIHPLRGSRLYYFGIMALINAEIVAVCYAVWMAICRAWSNLMSK